MKLTKLEKAAVVEILSRRANEIAGYIDDNRRDKLPASVEFGLSREIKRLRDLAEKLKPAEKPEEETE